MAIQEFKASLVADNPPPLDNLLLALWHDAKGDWDAAHDIAQDMHTRDGSWLHAYLHRKEGDQWNAGYWYRQAGKPVHAGTLEQEWEELVRAFSSPI
jgi:hypothetical protein